jgi:endonuclease YncB( thermonuclease family)
MYTGNGNRKLLRFSRACIITHHHRPANARCPEDNTMRYLERCLVRLMIVLLSLLVVAGCTLNETASNGNTNPPSSGDGEMASVTRVIDGDTIEVNLNGQLHSVRYIGMNTPERDETCFAEATSANAALVQGQTVRLVKDVSETDRYNRLLRYVYVGDVFVNARLVEEGYAEVVSYPPDNANYDLFKSLEIQAASANLGCHPTGIFNDGSYTR